MRLKRKNLIIIYLFTASIFLTGLWRFSENEKVFVLEVDNDRLDSISVIVEDIYYYEDGTESCFSQAVFSGSVLPLNNGIVTSAFGYRNDPFSSQDEQTFHNGIDIAVELQTEVLSVSPGIVSFAEYDEVGGNFVKIDHGNGFESYYGHLSEIKVNVGEKITVGQVIGLSGDSGKVTGPHLHFGLYYNGIPVDPDVYFNITKLISHSE